jgi:acyl-CoA thioesterase-2
MTRAPVRGLVELLELEMLEVNLFRGVSRAGARQRVYGGQVAAQALMAAGRTVPEDRPVHSLHAYFLRPGDTAAPIVYQVDRIRDGRSFTTRRVVAIQHGHAIFHLSASFQVVEEGLDYAAIMPDVPPPESIPSGYDPFLAYQDPGAPQRTSLFDDASPIELRYIDPPGPNSISWGPTRDLWMRARRGIPDDDPLLRACVLTYASDLALTGTIILAHTELRTDDLMVASLDHAVWFHRPFRVDEWLLFHQTSPSASGARGLGLGTLFRADGTLVASVMQEGLIRVRKSSP